MFSHISTSLSHSSSSLTSTTTDFSFQFYPFNRFNSPKRHFSSVVSTDIAFSPVASVESISEDLKNQTLEHNNGNNNNNYGRDGVNIGMNVDNICQNSVKLKLEELKWDHSFVRELLGDPRSYLTPREV
ncbi:hypothetical protein PHJA_002264800 [Phtheirospermum japonicum]|uniref:Uncharacterized protein n=1 Tax=Phtheirospermum japonicum TaxID=374723 RepID=A0A830CU97_9LAMI|nr:hypothetical protein PHJA_002264800 [Phtheirospermum japonicum]